jgi:hypothetical protein
MRSRRLASFIIPVALVTAVAAGAIPAQAATRNSTCSLRSLSNLQVQREDNGRLSIDFGVDMVTHRSGVHWTYRVVDNRSVVMRGTASTIADGSFSVTRAITRLTGSNHIVATAKNPATGETCRIWIIG